MKVQMNMNALVCISRESNAKCFVCRYQMYNNILWAMSSAVNQLEG